MLSMLWDTRHYFFWLMAISLFCWLLERLLPWREDQKVWRDQFAQDLFWLVFNGHYAGLLVATGAGWVLQPGGACCGRMAVAGIAGGPAFDGESVVGAVCGVAGIEGLA